MNTLLRAGRQMLALVLLTLCTLSSAGASGLYVVPGDDIKVMLRSNATTGYSWTVVPASAAGHVTVDKGTYVSPSTRLAGAPGWQVFHVKVQRGGKVSLQFAYARPWEKNVKPVRTYTLPLEIGKQTNATQMMPMAVYCNPDDVFPITLPSNPSTGYQWSAVRRPDGGVAMLQSSKYIPPAKPMPGAGGQMQFVFKGTGVGQTLATMDYARAGTQAAKTAQVLITVAK